MAQVEKIAILRKGAKTMRRRTVEHLEMKGQIFHEFKALRQAGKPVKRLCFVRRAKQILNKKNPGQEVSSKKD